jgi:hypothetical protein
MVCLRLLTTGPKCTHHENFATKPLKPKFYEIIVSFGALELTTFVMSCFVQIPSDL